jgi:hypothetical protein
MVAAVAVVKAAAKAGKLDAQRDAQRVVQTDAARDATVADAVVVVANARAAHNANDSMPKANHWICRPPPPLTRDSNRAFANSVQTVAHVRSGENAADAKARAVARMLKTATIADQQHGMKCVAKRQKRVTTRPAAKVSAMKPRVNPARAVKVDAAAGAVVAGGATTGAYALRVRAPRVHHKSSRHSWALRLKPQTQLPSMAVNLPTRATAAKCVKSAPATAMVANVAPAVNATTTATSAAIAPSKTRMPVRWMRQTSLPSR